MKTILLTGATGYLGYNISKKLLENGYKIIALCLNKAEKYKFYDNKNVKVYYLSETSVTEIFNNNKIDIVIHLATLYGRQNEEIHEMISANIEFPVNVLMQAIKHNVRIFINTDTILVKNLNPYSLTKSQFSEWLAMFSDKIKCVDMKLDHFYGPNDKPVKFVAWIIEQLRNNVEKIDLTEGSQTRDFIYVDDVTDAFMCVVKNADKIPQGQLNKFEVGTNVKTSIKTLVTTIKKLIGNTKTNLNFGAIPYRKNEVLDYEIDTTALRLLGWTPKVTDIEKGLKKILKSEGGIK